MVRTTLSDGGERNTDVQNLLEFVFSVSFFFLRGAVGRDPCPFATPIRAENHILHLRFPHASKAAGTMGDDTAHNPHTLSTRPMFSLCHPPGQRPDKRTRAADALRGGEVRARNLPTVRCLLSEAEATLCLLMDERRERQRVDSEATVLPLAILPMMRGIGVCPQQRTWSARSPSEKRPQHACSCAWLL